MVFRAQSPTLNGKSIFLGFSAMLLFFRLADSLMSYVVPIFLEHALGSVTLMGVVMSTSSIAGVTTDILFARFFVGRRSKFYYKMMMVSAFLFPLSMIIFQSLWGFVLSMLIWGFYYEALSFGNYLFVDETVQQKNHAWAWGIIAFVVNLAYIIGPMAASVLLDLDSSLPYGIAVSLYFISLVLLIVLFFSIKKRSRSGVLDQEVGHHSFHQKLQVWKLYFSRIGHLLLLLMMFYFIDATFFSIGPIFAETLKEIHPLGGLFVSLYSFPGLIGGILVIRFAQRFSKKKIAFIGGIMAGLGLLLLSITHEVAFILIVTFWASFGMSLMYPSLGAVMEDLVGRSRFFAKDLIALTSIAGSIGYIISPALNGVLAERFSPQFVFGFWGGLLFIYSCVLFFTVHGKTKLPQAALSEIE